MTQVLPKVFIHLNELGNDRYKFTVYFSGFKAISVIIKIKNNIAFIDETFLRKAIKNKDFYFDALNERVAEFLQEKKIELLDEKFNPIEDIYFS